MRMGLHTGQVVRQLDVNGNMNVSGDGINVAQRVMDFGAGAEWARGFVFGQITGVLFALGFFEYLAFRKAAPSFTGDVIEGITSGLFSAVIWAMAFALAERFADSRSAIASGLLAPSSSTTPARLGSFPSPSFGSPMAGCAAGPNPLNDSRSPKRSPDSIEPYRVPAQPDEIRQKEEVRTKTLRFSRLLQSALSSASKPLSPQLSRAEFPNEPRLLLGSVVYFFLGAALEAEALCSFF